MANISEAEVILIINGIFHIEVMTDNEGFYYPGIYKMSESIAGTPRVVPIITMDKKLLKGANETKNFIE